MALTLVIVSFSCTGPILGSLLGSAVTGSSNVPMLLTFALAGFGLAWQSFWLISTISTSIAKLTKIWWLDEYREVVLGFVELALALKFLSKADLVSKTFLIKRELFIAIWIVIAIGLALYLFGLIRFPHDDKKPKNLLDEKDYRNFGIGFVIYLIQGLVPGRTSETSIVKRNFTSANVSYFHNEKDGILGMKPEHDSLPPLN